MTTNRFIELISDLPKITRNISNDEKSIIHILKTLEKKAEILDNIKELDDCVLCSNMDCLNCTNNHSDEFKSLKSILDSI
jgi:hypothetical protein